MRRWILSTVYYKDEFLDSSQTITIVKEGRDLRSRLIMNSFSKIVLHHTLICINSNVPERTV